MVKALSTMTAASDQLQGMKSFASGCLLPGDSVIVPAGVLMLEKLLNAHSIGMRAPIHMSHQQCGPSIKVLKKVAAEILCFGLLKLLLGVGYVVFIAGLTSTGLTSKEHMREFHVRACGPLWIFARFSYCRPGGTSKP